MIIEDLWEEIKNMRNRYTLMYIFKNSGYSELPERMEFFELYLSSLLSTKIYSNDENAGISFLLTEQIISLEKNIYKQAFVVKHAYSDKDNNIGVPELEAQFVMINMLFENSVKILHSLMNYDGGEKSFLRLKDSITQMNIDYINLYKKVEKYEPFKIHDLKNHYLEMKSTWNKEQKIKFNEAISYYPTLIQEVRVLVSFLQLLPQMIKKLNVPNEFGYYLRERLHSNTNITVFEENLIDKFLFVPRKEPILNLDFYYEAVNDEKIFKEKNPYLLNFQKRQVDFSDVKELEKMDYSLFENIDGGLVKSFENKIQELENKKLPLKSFVEKKEVWLAINGFNNLKEKFGYLAKNIVLNTEEKSNSLHFMNIYKAFDIVGNILNGKDKDMYSQILCINAKSSEEIDNIKEGLVLMEKEIKNIPETLKFGNVVKSIKDNLSKKENSEALISKLGNFYKMSMHVKEKREAILKDSFDNKVYVGNTVNNLNIVDTIRVYYKAFEMLEILLLPDLKYGLERLKVVERFDEQQKNKEEAEKKKKVRKKV